MPRQIFLQQPLRIYSFYLVFFLLMSWGTSLQAASCTLTIEVFRKTLNEFLSTATVSSSLREQPVSSASTRAVIKDHLDTSLLTGALEVEGVNYTFILPGQEIESHIEVLMLSYIDQKTAMGMQQRFTGKSNYFKNTVILTRFSSVSVGNHLLLSFTEKSGNEAVVKLVDELPEFLKRKHGTCNLPGAAPPRGSRCGGALLQLLGVPLLPLPSLRAAPASSRCGEWWP